jgi:hypothetical protein
MKTWKYKEVLTLKEVKKLAKKGWRLIAVTDSQLSYIIEKEC